MSTEKSNVVRKKVSTKSPKKAGPLSPKSTSILKNKTQKVTNPLTDREIVIGGPTHRKLETLGYKFNKRTNKFDFKGKAKQESKPTAKNIRDIKGLSIAKPGPLEEDLKNISHSRPALRQHVKHLIKNQHDGRGSATRGWSAIKPQHGKERHELKKECGDKCFLKPETEQFPICPKLTSSDFKCKIDRRGLQSAYNRARQYKYENIANTAKKLLNQMPKTQ